MAPANAVLLHASNIWQKINMNDAIAPAPSMQASCILRNPPLFLVSAVCIIKILNNSLSVPIFRETNPMMFGKEQKSFVKDILVTTNLALPFFPG